MMDRRMLLDWAGTVRGLRAILAAQRQALAAEIPGRQYWARRAWWAEYWLHRTTDMEIALRLLRALTEAKAMLRELEQRAGVAG